MTTTDRYPYSLIEELGDKSDERSPFPRPTRWVNYIEDSVKATVDAATGKVTFYKIKDDPVVRAWTKIYPGLFTPADQMPEGVQQPADVSDAAAPHPVRRSLHLLPHERPHVLLQHGRHVGRRGRGPRADPRHGQGDHVLDRALRLHARHRATACSRPPTRRCSTRWRWCSRRRRR